MKTRYRKFTALALLAAMILLLAMPATALDRRTRMKTLMGSATVTAGTGYTSGLEVSAYSEALIMVDVTAESGTSTLDVTLQVSHDDSTWFDCDAGRHIVGAGQYFFPATNYGKYVRVKYVVGGTSMTFEIIGVFKN